MKRIEGVAETANFSNEIYAMIEAWRNRPISDLHPRDPPVHGPQKIYLNGIGYINPPLFHRALRPRLSFSGLDAPTFRSNSSP